MDDGTKTKPCIDCGELLHPYADVYERTSGGRRCFGCVENRKSELEAEVERLNKLVTMGNGVMVEKAYLNGLKARLEAAEQAAEKACDYLSNSYANGGVDGDIVDTVAAFLKGELIPPEATTPGEGK